MEDPIVILHVCDEPQRLGIRFILSIAGYSVLLATNSSAALKQLSSCPVALVLVDQSFLTSDAMLPREMKQLKPNVPIAVVVPSLSRTPLRSSLGDLLLAKEVDPPELLATVAKALTRDSNCVLQA
jgi:CheY-like chemotaxis protein